jgi:hypothetical protein
MIVTEAEDMHTQTTKLHVIIRASREIPHVLLPVGEDLSPFVRKSVAARAYVLRLGEAVLEESGQRFANRGERVGNYFDAEAFRARPIGSGHRDFVRQNSADLVACLQEPNSKQAAHRSRANGSNSHGLPNVH